MNLAIYTTELIEERRALMPWRIFLEVAKHVSMSGHGVVIYSGDGRGASCEIGGQRILYVDKPKTRDAIYAFVNNLREERIQLVYLPIVPGRIYRQLVQRLVEARIDVVWYFGGAWYDLRQIVKAANIIPLSQLSPYLFQALIPKRVWVWVLIRSKLFPIIAMTPFTAEKLVESGYPRSSVQAIYPGKEAVVGTAPGVCSPVVHPCGLDSARLSGRRFFLFFGPPAAIRGIYCILDAFRLISVRYPDAALVCLFRSDTNAAGNRTSVMRAIEEVGCKDRILSCWESASPRELDWFLKHAFAVLKPFVIVPSEIPLAVIEAAQYGKPVIGFQGDGTGRYIEEVGLAVPRMDVKSLALAMGRLLSDQDLYRSRCDAARATYASHPTWEEVAQQWLRVGTRTGS